MIFFFQNLLSVVQSFITRRRATEEREMGVKVIHKCVDEEGEWSELVFESKLIKPVKIKSEKPFIKHGVQETEAVEHGQGECEHLCGTCEETIHMHHCLFTVVHTHTAQFVTSICHDLCTLSSLVVQIL